jgi:hypothetical protein
MADSKLFTNLQRLFSTDVIIRNIGGNNLKVIDPGRIQSSGIIQTNALVDRFNKIYTTSNNYTFNYNLAQNYQALRISIYNDYEGMDTDAIIASSLDVLADECTLPNEAGEILQIRSNDENIQKILYNLFYDVLNIEFNLWSWVRNMCKYGDFYVKLEIAEKLGVYNAIPFSPYVIMREEGFDPKNPTLVRYSYQPTPQSAPNAQGFVTMPNTTGGEKIMFDNYEMTHFRLVGDFNYLPYGRSYLEPARKVYKQLVLMEDAMLIHRIVRAPEKRIFYVNVGSIPAGEVENFMQRMISKMKKTPYIDPQTGQYNLKFNMQNMLEDIFIPVRGNDTTTKIDKAPSLEYNGIDDVNYLRDKLFAALRIPKAFLGYEKDLTGKATLAAEDIRFARTISRIQKIVVSELTKIALVHLYSQGFTDESLTNFEIQLTNPSIIYDQERIALWKEKVDLANQMMEKGLLPTDWIYDFLFQFSEDQFDELRDLILEDKKREFRYKQITDEGNDPMRTGLAYGTPGQIAGLYGGNANMTAAGVPTGYNEKNPGEPLPEPGRPTNTTSIIDGPNDPLGRDRLGKKDKNIKGRGEDSKSIKNNFMGGSPLALENSTAKAIFHKYKDTLNAKKAPRKTPLFEDKKVLLDEDNIKPDIE